MSSGELEDVLVGLSAGELRVTDPRVVALLERSPEVRSRVEASVAIGRTLDRAGAWHRSVRDQSQNESLPALERRVAEKVRETASRKPSRAEKPWWDGRVLLAAAALAVVAVSWLAMRSLDSDGSAGLREGQSLGGAIRILEPTDGSTVEEYSRFAWSWEGGAGPSFEIDVYSVGPEGRPAAKVDSVTRIRSMEWVPEPGRCDAWPDAILWRVSAIEYRTVSVGSRFSSVRRSPR